MSFLATQFSGVAFFAESKYIALDGIIQISVVMVGIVIATTLIGRFFVPKVGLFCRMYHARGSNGNFIWQESSDYNRDSRLFLFYLFRRCSGDGFKLCF